MTKPAIAAVVLLGAEVCVLAVFVYLVRCGVFDAWTEDG